VYQTLITAENSVEIMKLKQQDRENQEIRKRIYSEIELEGKKGESLLSSLLRSHIYVNAVCGGNGLCGKCGVRMLFGVTEATAADRKFFREEELADGMRLACESYPEGRCRIRILSGDEDDFTVVTDGVKPICGNGELSADVDQPDLTANFRYDIAIDIGTTTLAVSLVSCENAQIIHTVTGVNHQRAYGADVISRIQAANEGHLSELSCCIRQDLYENMLRLLHESDTVFAQIRKIAVAGNTTMGHILMGYSCETLGVYPFKPVDISLTQVSFADLFETETAAGNGAADNGHSGHPSHGTSESFIHGRESTEVILLPGISAYVGADIAAGLLACGFDRTDQVNVLIDLGTNGEMAVGNREKILVTSTAAGPAFEGGNISCGMGSVPGAVSRVEIRDAETAGSPDGGDDSVRISTGAEARDIVCRTIGGKAPIGLCGTGVIETVYELLKQEWMDVTGLLDEAYFDNGFILAESPTGENIVFTQKDIREVQLAKSAVRAGLETLLLRYGVTYSEIGTLYLAGGFGDRIDLRKAAGIGLLPEELLEKTVAVGDSALRGVVDFLRDTQSEERLEQLIRVSGEIQLASDTNFNRFYMEYMLFPEC